MKHIALILILLAVVLRAGAQNYSGHVTDTNGKPLASVSVMLLDGKGKIVKFAKTDSKGVFTVKLPEGKTATQLSLVSVGYARKNLPLSKYKDGSTMAMEEKVHLEILRPTTPPSVSVRCLAADRMVVPTLMILKGSTVYSIISRSGAVRCLRMRSHLP